MMLAIISFQSKLTDVIYDKTLTLWINDLEISSVQENKTTPSKQRKNNKMKTRLWSQGKPVCVSFSSLSEFRQMYGGRESSTCYNFRKHMQIEKVEKEFQHFDSRWWKCSQHKQIKKHTVNAHNTTKYILFAARFFFGCAVSICSVCVVKLRKLFS